MAQLTNSQRQARRLTLLNDKARAAGWAGWREYETAIINSVVKADQKPEPNMWTDARGAKIGVGVSVALLNDSGRPSAARERRGYVVQVAAGRCLIERPAHENSGASSVRDWYRNDEFVVVH